MISTLYKILWQFYCMWHQQRNIREKVTIILSVFDPFLHKMFLLIHNYINLMPINQMCTFMLSEFIINKMKKDKTKPQMSIMTDERVLRKHHKFLRDSSSDSQNSQPQRSRQKKQKNHIHDKYGEQLAKKYYKKLYKEFAVVDLSRFETGQIGCRWRTQKQVVTSKGQRICGGIGCGKKSEDVYEMNFGYMEEGGKKNALVKVSVCCECGRKLNHKKALTKIEHMSEK